ncbi:hypothetical protein [Xylella fastidiosa]|uniref:hypothetical protein n=1 Tax=Xylella fastidiosa TaxID=2371 RepID=UPI0004676D6B|nr:hypothetical protein [Xylella fastidiosa]UIX82025.1 hypothetical protein LZ756_03975 [Xylella fastidiosa subsp. sandyi]
MSLDITQIVTLCLAVFSTAVNAWVVFKLGTGGFHQHVSFLGDLNPKPPLPSSDWGDGFNAASGDGSHVGEASTLKPGSFRRGDGDKESAARPKAEGELDPAKAVSNDGGSFVGRGPFLKGNLCHCHCQVTQVCHLHTFQRRASGDCMHGPVSNLQPNSVAANHLHRVKNAKRRAKHRQSKC